MSTCPPAPPLAGPCAAVNRAELAYPATVSWSAIPRLRAGRSAAWPARWAGRVPTMLVARSVVQQGSVRAATIRARANGRPSARALGTSAAAALGGAEENGGELLGGKLADPLEDPVPDDGENGVHGELFCPAGQVELRVDLAEVHADEVVRAGQQVQRLDQRPGRDPAEARR